MIRRFVFLFLVLLCCGSVVSAGESVPRLPLPVPPTVSSELQRIIAAAPPADWNNHPKDTAAWQTWRAALEQPATAAMPALRKALGVSVERATLGGVAVFVYTPENLPEDRADRVLICLHGGGYVFGSGESAAQESIMMAGLGQYRVVHVDYRLAPEWPYPAAIDDAMRVYRAVLATTPASRVGVLGTSTGGGMALILALRARAEGIPLPAALGAGTPWVDLTKTGDSYATNEGVDTVLVSYEGWLRDAADVYAGGHDMRDPMLSPIYGNVHDFPPTLLTTGTRDLFLSNTVRMHLKLRQAGVAADLLVFEGISHAQYLAGPDVPETRWYFKELAQFFDAHLQERRERP